MTNLSVTTNPHIRHKDTSKNIMLDVIIALIPALIGGTILFGYRVILLAAVSVAAAVLSEYFFCKIVKKPISTGDLSAVVTGLLLALNLPATLPLWMAAVGSVAAIVVVKQFFGGIGQNFANPAITARIILIVSFPSAMTNWVAPFAWLGGVDGVTSATPLAGGEFSRLDLFLGLESGSIGETSALFLILGGLYLIARRVINPIIPLSFIGVVGICSLIAGGDFLTSILSGGLMLGAIFMATDYTTSPNNNLGRLIFGIGCGLITFIIRQFGSLPEGVSYAILIMNILNPYINMLTAKKPFGWEGKKK